MTKNILLKEIAAKAEMRQKDIDKVLACVADVVVEAMEKNDDVTLPGLGKFSVKVVPERTGKIMMGNRAGEQYVVPQHKEPKFKLASNFKKMFIAE